MNDNLVKISNLTLSTYDYNNMRKLSIEYVKLTKVLYKLLENN